MVQMVRACGHWLSRNISCARGPVLSQPNRQHWHRDVTWLQGFNGVFTLSTQAGASEHLRSISDPMDGPARLRNPIDQRSAAQMPSCASDAPLWLRRDDTACIELDVSGYALEYH